ncbi:hypothetical protein KW783_03990 [Candidatus Parcubacteria bacterium]|nr:hypothetical protein [Candidatus Parcubacteria bacterium]
MPEYTLEFCEGHGLRSEPEPVQFTADNDDDAIAKVAKSLGHEPPIALDKFQAADYKSLWSGISHKQIFPERKVS